MSSIAKENGIYVFGANTRKEEDGTFRNVGFVFNREGRLIIKHYKIVLTPPEEKDGLVPGNTIEIFDTEFGKMALLVCKDSFHRYASWFFDAIRKAGVDVVLIPSYSINVSRRSIGLWIDSLKSLSKWFDVYVVASGTVGKNNTDYDSFGHALIVCPNREILAEGSFDKEELLYANLDKSNLEEIRNTYGSKWQPPEVPKFKIKKMEMGRI
jgi:predicted amidohydrolase